jgi:hypothetical protein
VCFAFSHRAIRGQSSGGWRTRRCYLPPWCGGGNTHVFLQCHVNTKTPNIYQDRLGTDMGKLENKKGCFCRAFPSARTAPAGSDLLRAAFRCHRSHTTAPTSSATSASRYHSTRIGRPETSGRQQQRTGFRAMRAFRTTPLRTKSSRCAEESRKENRRERWLISLAVKSDRLSRQAPDRHEAITTESGLIHCFVACVRQSSH